MSSKESIQSSENLDWEPSIATRPHHVRIHMGNKFRNLLQLYSPINLAIALISSVKYLKEHVSYQQDAWGTFGTPEYRESEQAKKSFEDELKNLPDSAVAQLGLPMDIICNACPIGKHCTATNYESLGRHVDYVALEETELGAIHKKLLAKGFQEEVDFKLLPATETLLDYQGQNLWTNTQPPVPKVVEYNAILVRMGALRKVV